MHFTNLATCLQRLHCQLASMGLIRNVIFLCFRDVTKQNGHGSVGNLYREPLGEIVFTMITFIIILSKKGQDKVYTV